MVIFEILKQWGKISLLKQREIFLNVRIYSEQQPKLIRRTFFKYSNAYSVVFHIYFTQKKDGTSYEGRCSKSPSKTQTKQTEIALILTL